MGAFIVDFALINSNSLHAVLIRTSYLIGFQYKQAQEPASDFFDMFTTFGLISLKEGGPNIQILVQVLML